MKGFRDFVLRGNLIELAVAFIVGAAFAALIEAFTKVILEAIGKITGGRRLQLRQRGSPVAGPPSGRSSPPWSPS